MPSDVTFTFDTIVPVPPTAVDDPDGGIPATSRPNGIGFNGSNVGACTISSVLVQGFGQAIDIDGGNLDVILGGAISLNSGAEGINLNNVSGSFSVTGVTTVNNPTGTGINITGGSANHTFAGTEINGRNAIGINIMNTSGVIEFGTTTLRALSSGTGTGINIDGITNDLTFGRTSITGSGGDGINIVNLSGTAGTAVQFGVTTLGGNGNNISGTGINLSQISAASTTIP